MEKNLIIQLLQVPVLIFWKNLKRKYLLLWMKRWNQLKKVIKEKLINTLRNDKIIELFCFIFPIATSVKLLSHLPLSFFCACLSQPHEIHLFFPFFLFFCVFKSWKKQVIFSCIDLESILVIFLLIFFQLFHIYFSMIWWLSMKEKGGWIVCLQSPHKGKS